MIVYLLTFFCQFCRLVARVESQGALSLLSPAPCPAPAPAPAPRTHLIISPQVVRVGITIKSMKP